MVLRIVWKCKKQDAKRPSHEMHLIDKSHVLLIWRICNRFITLTTFWLTKQIRRHASEKTNDQYMRMAMHGNLRFYWSKLRSGHFNMATLSRPYGNYPVITNVTSCRYIQINGTHVILWASPGGRHPA